MSQASEAFTETFVALDESRWHVADYVFSHPHFDTDWRREGVHIANGAELALSPQTGHKNRFAGASVRRLQKSGYGRYEVVLQPARGSGVITGFFTYTGRYYGTRHDEIDIEFLGRDTTKLHVAWFVDGQLSNRFIDLGFDAADSPRRYGFDWHPDSITWFVEGQPVFTISAAEAKLPKVPGFVFANIWAADPALETWSGVPEHDTRATARISEMRFTPLFDVPPSESAGFQERPGAAATRLSKAPEVPRSGG